MKKILMCTMIITTLSSAILAQDSQETVTAKTKLEQFSAKTGVVVVHGFQEIGTVKGRYSTSVKVQVEEFANLNDGSKQYGVTVETLQESTQYPKKHTSYIDYDEIESLIKGIQYIEKVDSTASQLKNFQADYATRGNLKVTTFSSDGKVKAAVTSGSITGVQAFLNIEDLEKLKALIEQAKSTIDQIRK